MASPDANSCHESEFVRLYTTNSRRIYTYILTLLPNRVDAEDVFQDVSTLLWEKFGEFTPGSQFGAWACRIAYFLVLKHRSKKAVRDQFFSEAAMEAIRDEVVTMDDSLDGEYRALAGCLAALSESDRHLIQRRYGPSGSPRELAALLSWPVRRVYKTLERIRKVLLGCVLRKLSEGSKT